MQSFAFSYKKVHLLPLQSLGLLPAPNGTKIVHYVEKFILFNPLKSELQYCNPVWNGSMTKEIVPRKMLIFRLIG